MSVIPYIVTYHILTSQVTQFQKSKFPRKEKKFFNLTESN